MSKYYKMWTNFLQNYGLSWICPYIKNTSNLKSKVTGPTLDEHHGRR